MPKKANGEDKLLLAGWRHDGLWWYSPKTGHRYAKKEALAVLELRAWAASDSAILGDKDHSMWVLAEERDNALIDMEELSRRCHQRRLLRDSATRSNLKGEGTD